MKQAIPFLIVLTLVAGGFTTLTSCAKGSEGTEIALQTDQKLCPVMGNEIDPRYYTDYKGKRIYFCCPACIDEFKKNPDTYMKKLKGKKLPNSPRT